jgi:hypothetical protein
MFKKKDIGPTIKFRARDDLDGIFPKPKVANKFMPDWFKKLDRVVPGAKTHDPGTAKRCVPISDAVSNGFIIPLWADMHVEIREGDEGKGIWCQFPDTFGLGQMISNHAWDQVGDACPVDKFDLGKVLLKFLNPWVIETSPGYSVLFKNPPHAYSDIEILEGVVDTDTYRRQINFPFIWTGTEVGEWIIPKGTPLIHVVPFKRETFNVEYSTWDHEEMTRIDRKHQTTFFDKYRKLWWHKRKPEPEL